MRLAHPLCSLTVSLAALLAAWPSQAQTYIGGVTFPSRTEAADAHSRALGGAAVALRGYAGAAQINPAAIGRAGTAQVSTNLSAGPAFRTPWHFNNGWLAGPTADVRLGRWAAAYQYQHLSYGRHTYTDESGNVLRTLESYDYAHELAAAYRPRPNLSAGLGLNLIRSVPGAPPVAGDAPLRAGGFSLDLGLHYERAFAAPYVRLTPSLGWSLTDFGRPLRYGDEGQRDPLPMTMRGGLALQAETNARVLDRPLLRLGLYGQLSKVLTRTEVDKQSGDRELYGPLRALFGAWRSYEIDYGDPLTVGVRDQLTTHRGAEVALLGILSLRRGFYRRPVAGGAGVYVPESRAVSSGGWGLDLYYLALERAWVSWASPISAGEVELSFWRLTARVPLGGEAEGNFWPDLLRYLQGSR